MANAKAIAKYVVNMLTQCVSMLFSLIVFASIIVIVIPFSGAWWFLPVVFGIWAYNTGKKEKKRAVQ